MPVRRLWLDDYRNHESVDLVFAPGLTMIIGDNGEGKTNLLEGLAWLSTGSSFRGAPTESFMFPDGPTGNTSTCDGQFMTTRKSTWWA